MSLNVQFCLVNCVLGVVRANGRSPLRVLATVHWVATKESEPAQDSEQAIALVHEWSDRKRKLFKPEHIRKAWQRLYDQNWLNINEQITS